MSDTSDTNIQDDILDKVLENQTKFGNMGNLQHSINRSLEVARSSKPSYLSGENKSTNHLVYEMNEFYIEMAQKISELNVKRYDAFLDDDDNDVDDEDSVLSDVVNAIRRKRNDPEMKKQIETVLKLDQLMDETYKALKAEKMERQTIQDELCNLIEHEDDAHSRSRLFKDLCDLENRKLHNSSKINQLVIEDQNQLDKQRKLDAINGAIKKDDKFIKRNIQLAKNTPTMYNPSFSLTDEEKIKLETLLSDIDKIELEDDVAERQQCDPEPDDEPMSSDADISLENNRSANSLTSNWSTNYPFSFSEDDQTRLKELDTELQSLSEILHLQHDINEETVERNADDGKLWLNENRLKQLDEKLEKLQSEREAFVYTPSINEVHQHPPTLNHSDENDTTNDVESISYDTIRERSQKMVENLTKVIKTMEADDTSSECSILVSDDDNSVVDADESVV